MKRPVADLRFEGSDEDLFDLFNRLVVERPDANDGTWDGGEDRCFFCESYELMAVQPGGPRTHHKVARVHAADCAWLAAVVVLGRDHPLDVKVDPTS